MSEEKFKIGDCLQNKQSYSGESEKMIFEITDDGYKCYILKGKHQKKNFDESSTCEIDFDAAHKSYERVG